MLMLSKYDALIDLPPLKYEGYLWLSNKRTPEVFHGETIDFAQWEAINPFIIEGLLYNRAKQFSVLIRHTGTYTIRGYDLTKIPQKGILEPVEFLPHRLNKTKGKPPIEKVEFQQLWLPEKDANCENMEVLSMRALVFTGFKNH